MAALRWAGILAIAVLLPVAVPAAAEERSAFQTWLHHRSPDDPFRYYGFFEAASKYFRAHVLGGGTDPLDVTTVTRVVDVSEKRDALLAEVEALEGKLAGVPLEIAERDEHLAAMRAAKAEVDAQLAEATRRFEAAEASLAGGTIVETSQMWDDRTKYEQIIEKLRRRKAQIDDEIVRTEMGRIKAMQTGTAVDELAQKKRLLKAVESGEEVVGVPTDYYLVSHKPLLLLILGCMLLLVGASVPLGKRPGKLPVTLLYSAAMAGVLYAFLAVVRAEQWIPPKGIVASPAAFAAGFAALMAARAVAKRIPRHVPDTWALKIALVAVAVVQLWTPVRYLIFGTSVLLDAVLPILFFGAWGFVAIQMMESQRHLILQVLVVAVVTLATVMVGSLNPWFGVGGSIAGVLVGIVVGTGLVAADEACGRVAAAPQPAAPAPEGAPEPEQYQVF
jgi:hypothetical protein